MAAQVKNFHLESHSKIVSKNTPPRNLPPVCGTGMVNRGSKKHNMSSSRGEELLKEVLRKGTIEKGNNVIESKESKKSSICGHNKGGKELLKVVTKGTEKLSIKESKCKSGGTQSRMCFCAPTTHEGSFKCRLHRKNKTNLRFASVPCAQVGTDHGSP